MTYSAGYVNSIYNYADITINCLENLSNQTEDIAPVGFKVWFIILVGFIAFAVPFMRRLRKQKFPECDKDYEKLEGKYTEDTATEDLLKEIGDFYSDKKTLRDLFKNGGIFRRKSDLLNRINTGKNGKEFKVLMATAVIAGLIAAVLDGNLLGYEIKKMGSVSSNIAMATLVGLLFFNISTLFNIVMYDFETERCQIIKYELQLIDKLIDKYAENRLSAGTMTERRRETKSTNSYREIKDITTTTTLNRDL